MVNVVRIGHRGAAGYAPENTPASFARALELGVDMIEFDIRRCATGEVVVVHDEDLSRFGGSAVPVDELSLDELRQIDLGGGQRVPTLREVLDLTGRKACLNIELKDSESLQPLQDILDEYRSSRGWQADDFLVSSFNHFDLWKIKESHPDIPVAPLVAAVPPEFAAFAREMRAYSVHVEFHALDRAFIEDAHVRELKVFAFTADDREDIARLKEMGVDGIFSNCPDLI